MVAGRGILIRGVVVDDGQDEEDLTTKLKLTFRV